MSKPVTTTIRTTVRRLEYLRALSRQMGCKFKEKGSAAYVINYWIDAHARKHCVNLD